MKVWVHFLTSAILAAIVYPFYGWKVIFVFVGGVLIDFDHFLWYAWKNKTLNIFESYRYFMKHMVNNNFEMHYDILLIFHVTELLLLGVLASFFSVYALMFTLGLILHYSLDIVFELSTAKRIVQCPSFFLWLFKYRHKNKYRD